MALTHGTSIRRADRSPWALPASVLAYALAVLAGRATRLDGTRLALLALVWPAAPVAVLWFAHARATGRTAVHSSAMVVTTVVANLLTGACPWLAAGFAAANLVQAVVTVSVLPAGAGLRSTGALGRLVLACTGGALASAAVGAVALALAGADPLLVVGLWTVRNTSSAVVVVAVALHQQQRRQVGRRTAAGRLEAVLVVALLGIGVALVYTTPSAPAGLVLLPLSVWVALRCSTTVVCAHVLLTATVVVVLGSVGRGPFAEQPPVVGVLLVQAFVLVLAVVALALSLTGDERTDLAHRLRPEQRASAAQAALLETVLDTVDVAIVAATADGRALLRSVPRQAGEPARAR